MKAHLYARPVTRQRGVTLIELMVAMVLGLLLIAGAVSLTLANRRSHDTNEGLSQIQESARTAFEMLARDVRQSGPAGCGNPARITNDLVAGTLWWQTWFGIRGYESATASASAFGTAAGQRVSTTDAIQTQGLQGTGFDVANHDQAAATMTVNPTATDIVVGDVMMICDADHTTLFQAATYDSGTGTVGSAINVAGVVPGNCSSGLGYPSVCSEPGTVYKFARNSLLAHFAATEWYIGRSGRTTDTGKSLFRLRLGSGGVVVPAEEIVADVTDMQIKYRVGTATGFVDAGSPSLLTTADWANVNAVQIMLTVDSADTRVTTTPGTNSGRISRSFTQVIALRNRMP